jgi:hypothetical protein
MSSDVMKLIAETERQAAADAKAEARAEREQLLNTLKSIDRQLAAMAEKPAPRLTRSGMTAAEKSRTSGSTEALDTWSCHGPESRVAVRREVAAAVLVLAGAVLEMEAQVRRLELAVLMAQVVRDWAKADALAPELSAATQALEEAKRLALRQDHARELEAGASRGLVGRPQIQVPKTWSEPLRHQTNRARRSRG